MAKAKATRKWIKDNYTCAGVGYCDIYYLTRFQEPRFYTCGVYGWNMDVYTFGDYALTTGYRGMITHGDCVPDNYRDIIRGYETRAKECFESFSYNAKDAVNKLLADCLKEVFGIVAYII